MDDAISVLSSVEVQTDENGDFKYATPIYVNQRYPWGNYESVDYSAAMGDNATAPTVKNGVAHFQRIFDVAEEWMQEGRQVYISFQGVESAFYLYINGQRVGYVEDSYTADDFNITPYLNLDGKDNVISVQVYRWSIGSYLENQDMIRLSGIFRDVYLYSKADVEIRDFFLKPQLSEDLGTGTLEVDVNVCNHGAAKTAQVEVQLYPTDSDTPLLDEPITLDYELDAAQESFAEQIDDTGVRHSGSAVIDQPLLWSADQPNLYRALIVLRDADGNVIETACQKIGFRRLDNVVINEDGQYQLQINNEKIMIRGTNRHEAEMTRGRALTFEDIKSDLMKMK